VTGFMQFDNLGKFCLVCIIHRMLTLV